MVNLFAVADRYLQTLNWQKFSLAKICMVSFGVALGLCLGEKYKKVGLPVAVTLFLVTYLPILADLFKSAKVVDQEMYL